MRVFNSILSSIDDVLNEGDYFIDPFFILDVVDIDIKSHDFDSHQDILLYINIMIDSEKLFKETTEFNINNWNHLTCTNHFINNTDYENELILRFIWYICYSYIYNEKQVGVKKVDLTKIIKDEKIHNTPIVYIFISKEYNYLNLNITGITGSLANLKFKNNSKLI